MAMKRCPVCGEKYSETYRDCPFCEEDEALMDGEEIRRAPRRGRRTAHGRQFSLITPTLIILILIMAGLLVYLLRDGEEATPEGEDAQETPAEKAPREKVKKTHFSPLRQTATLTARYFRLIFRNKGWLLGMIAVIPLAAVYIVGGLMASDKTLVYYSDTYKVQFTLICIAAFAGLMTAYNEICKERDVFEREASANLHISSYLLSKVTVLSCISLVQSVIMTAGFYWGVGDPGTSLLMPGYIEIGLTIFLTILSASCLGLLISAVFKTGESAAQPLIIVLIMQVVLSGAIMPLSGMTRTLANVICSFWGTNALSASTGLSNLPMEAINANGFTYTPDIPGYDYLAATEENLLTSLIWLAGISVVSILLAFASLKWRKQLEAVAGALRPRRK